MGKLGHWLGDRRMKWGLPVGRKRDRKRVSLGNWHGRERRRIGWRERETKEERLFCGSERTGLGKRVRER